MADSEYARRPQDFYGAGGIVSQLEVEIAELMGKEAAVFMPSGTMAQQIALRIWCDRAGNSRVAFHPTCHLELYEHHAYRELHRLESVLLGEPSRLFTLADLEAVHTPVAAVLVELPQREIGGQLPMWDDLTGVHEWAANRGVRLHLDGARLWECAPYYGRPYSAIAAMFDSVYVSFYKILGGLPGAMLAGPADFVAEAKVWQRRHGGNLHTLAPNAIAAKIGIDRHLPRIPAYCRKAAEIADALRGVEGLAIVPEHPPTNMMHLHFSGDLEAIEDAVYEVARETRLLLFARLNRSAEGVGVVELAVGEHSLEIDTAEIRELMEQAVARGRNPRSPAAG